MLPHRFTERTAWDDDAEILSPDQIADALRAGGRPADTTFDRHLPETARRASHLYWTPVGVAARAAELLDEFGARTVLDIGSGAGKFCVVASLAGRARLFGLEQRSNLATIARDLARTFHVEERVTFIDGALGATSLPTTDAFYLYNPFGENHFSHGQRLDDDVELSEPRFARDVALVDGLLRAARVGTYVLTYNGFGGPMPPSYDELVVDRTLPSLLRLWCKMRVG